jgi:hypothetical protein
VLTELAYAAESDLQSLPGEALLRLFTNLRRQPVCLDAGLADVLGFRDAMLALHDCARSELHVPAEEVHRRALDPVVTVTRRALFFEVFSLDESSYGRVSVRADGLRDVRTLQAGCTNVDFSPALRRALEQLAGSSATRLRVLEHALELQAGARRVREERIELPDGWVRGFLAVQAALGAPAVSLDLHPGDLRNLVAYLRGRRETVSPRALRFRLAPGQPPRVLIEPWNEEMVFRRSRHDALAEREIRIWGRRRLLVLQRVFPSARRITGQLQGTGLPSFWTVELGALSLTLGLSPWSERDWTADARPAAPPRPDEGLVERAAAYLLHRGETFGDELAAALGVGGEATTAVLETLCLRGRLLYDPASDLFLARRLFEADPP